MGHKERIELVSSDNAQLTVKRQCELACVNRSSVYRCFDTEEQGISHGESELNLELMKRLDALHYDYPAWGYRKIADYLRFSELYEINPKRVLRLMRIMDIRAIYPKPNLSKRLHAQYMRPYLLRDLSIDRVNQVWGVDITYLPMSKGFLYLFVIIDWFSRCIVDYEVSFSLDKSFVMGCLKRALCQHKPDIVNSDQGSHFTNAEYLELLRDNGVRVSMDGKGRALDNVRTERFFRSLKYEDIYIKDYASARELRCGVRDYINTYNTIRPHQSLGGQTPDKIYRQLEKQIA